MVGEIARDRCVLLIGMMGAGKSRVGRALAERLGFEFVDTDERVEASSAMTIAAIFATEGEGGFRARERAVLAALPERGAVVALGGGAVVDPANRAVLRTKGTRVWLDAEPEVLIARIGDPRSRPLLAGLDEPARIAKLRQLRAERAAAYADDSLRVRTDGLDVLEVCDSILAALARADRI